MVTLKPISLTHLVGKPGVEKHLWEGNIMESSTGIYKFMFLLIGQIQNMSMNSAVGPAFLVATKAQLGFGMPLFLPSFVIVVCSFFRTIAAGLWSRPRSIFAMLQSIFVTNQFIK